MRTARSVLSKRPVTSVTVASFFFLVSFLLCLLYPKLRMRCLQINLLNLQQPAALVCYFVAQKFDKYDVTMGTIAAGFCNNS